MSGFSQYCFLLFPLVWLTAAESEPFQDNDQAALTFLERVVHRTEGLDQQADLKIEIHKQQGIPATRHLRFWVHYAAANDTIYKQSTILALEDDKVAGQRAWTWEMTDGSQRQWVYLPGTGSLRQIRRRGIRQRDLSVLDDLVLTRDDINAHTHRMISSDDDGLVHIESTEVTKAEAARSSRIIRKPRVKQLWIDPVTLLVMKATIMAGPRKFEKEITVTETIEVGGIIMASRVAVTDDKGEKTTVTLSNIRIGQLPDLTVFQPRKLQ